MKQSFMKIAVNFFKQNFVFVISCMDIFAVSLVVPVFTQYLQSIGFSNFAIGLLNSVYSGVQFFSSPIIGHLSDIFGSKRVLLISLLLCSLCYPMMGFVHSFVSFIVIRSLIGFAKHTQLLCKNYIEESIDENKQFYCFSKLSGYTSLGHIVGPVLSGYVIDFKNGFFYMSCLTGLFFFFNFLFVFSLAENSENKDIIQKKRKETGFFNSFKNIPWSICWDLFLLKSLAVFAVFAFYINYSQSIKARYQISSVLVGYSFSLQGIIRSVSSFAIHRINNIFPSHLNNLSKLRIIYGIVIASLLCLYFSVTIYWYLAFLVPLNVCLCYLRILNFEALIERTKNYQKGGIILGAFNNVTAVARLLLLLISGYIVDKYDYDSVYVISIVSLLVGIFITSVCNQEVKAKAK